MKKWLMAACMLLVLAGCATAGAGSSGDVTEILRLAGSRESNPPMDGSELFSVDTVAAPADRAFAALRLAYEGLGIPFTFYEVERHRLGGYVANIRSLHDRPSQWLDCGRGITAEQYADIYQVSVTIASRVTGLDGTTSAVETVIRARARPRDVAAEMLRCRSFGTLESEIAERVADRVGR
jgi:uncharacterized lipoprotein YmbA